MENKNPVMPISKQRQVLFIVWVLTLLVWLPPTREYFLKTTYFSFNAHGLRNFENTLKYLLLILAWAVVLSIPKYRTEKNVLGTASSLLTLALLLQTFASLPLAGSLLFLLSGFALLFIVAGSKLMETVESLEADPVASKTPLQKRYSILPAWLSVILLAMPWLWVTLSGQDSFVWNMRALQDMAVAAPFLCIMVFWAVLLSLPAKRTFNTISGAAGSLFAMMVFFLSDPEFFQAHFLFMPTCMALMNAESYQKDSKLKAAFFARKIKKIFITPATNESDLARYYQAVSQKIDSYVSLNFPSAQYKKPQGKAYVSIPIKEDGSIYSKGDGIKLETTSGNHDLDLAALSIAHRSGPFPGFSKCKSTGRATEVRVIFYRLGFEDKLLPQDVPLSGSI